MSTMRYSFVAVEKCNMCGSPTGDHPVMGKRLNHSQGRHPGRKTGITTTICRCSSCGLVYSNPQPVPFDIQDHYGIPPESYWENKDFSQSDKYLEADMWRIKQFLGFREGMKLLDIGAGLGNAMQVFSQAGFETHGFEPSKAFYEKAISRGLSPERLKLGMIEEMDYPANEFHYISFGAVLEHLYDPSAAICKAMGWLQPGGLVHIEVPSARWMVNRLINTYYKVTGSGFVANLSPMHPPYHLYEFTPESFQAHAAANGYEIALSEFYVCETYLPRWMDVFLKPLMERTNTGMQLCVKLRKRAP